MNLVVKLINRYVKPANKLWIAWTGFVATFLVMVGLDAGLAASISVLVVGVVTVVFVYVIPNHPFTHDLERRTGLDLNQDGDVYGKASKHRPLGENHPAYKDSPKGET